MNDGEDRALNSHALSLPPPYRRRAVCQVKAHEVRGIESKHTNKSLGVLKSSLSSYVN